MLNKLLGITSVKALYLEITSKCQFRCLHCFQGENLNIPKEFTFQECVQILELFKDSYDTTDLVILGGEPFLHNDFDKIVIKAHEIGYNVDVCTNGYSNKKLVKIRKYLRTLRVSIDGLSESHDSVRKKGSFSEIKSFLEQCRNLNIRTSFTVTVNSLNYLELKNIIDFGLRFGISYFKFHEIHLSGFAKNNPWLVLNEFQKVQVKHSLIQLQNTYPSLLVIDSDLLLKTENRIPSVSKNVAERIEIQPNGRVYLSCKALGDNNNSLWYDSAKNSFSLNNNSNSEIDMDIRQVEYLEN